MKLSKNNKIYVANSLKDKANWQNFSETKAASICLYNSDIVLNITLKELESYNIDMEEIDNFLNFAKIFKEQENHKKLFKQIVIKSDNPFISSMLNMNRVSKVKYFLELICLNKIEIKEEYKFFNDFFEKIHNHNFLYIYKTNKINEYAEIRFSINVEDLFTKTYLVSKIPIQEQEIKDNFDININMNRYYKDNKIMSLNMNNSTIKEVTEDEKNRDSMQQFNFDCNDNDNDNYNHTSDIIKNNIGNERKNLNTDSQGDINLIENEPILSKISKTKLGKNNSKRLINDNYDDNYNEKFIEMEDYNSNECDNNFLNELENIEKRLNIKNKENIQNQNQNKNQNHIKNLLEPERDNDYDNNNNNNWNKIEEEKDKYNHKDKIEIKENIENSKDSKGIFSRMNSHMENSDENYLSKGKNTHSQNTAEKNIDMEENKRKKYTKEENVKENFKEKNNYVNFQKNDYINNQIKGYISPLRKRDYINNSLNNDEERKLNIENEFENYNNNNNNDNSPENKNNYCNYNNDKENKGEILKNKNENKIKKNKDFQKDEIFNIEFNIGNYNFIYIDLDYSLKKNMKSTLEKMGNFIKWAWNNFKYLKFVLYLPNISEFYLDLNQDLFELIIEIFSIADIILIEKKELFTYKKNLFDIFKRNNNKNYPANTNFNNNNNNNIGSLSNNLNQQNNLSNFSLLSNLIDKNYISNKTCKNKIDWEELFIKEFKIKKRGIPLTTYPTKTLIILDELNKVLIYEKNYDNKIIFKTENNFILYPQINHTNQNIIELYRNCVYDNYPELRGIYFSGFLSKIMQGPVKLDGFISRDYTGSYMISFEIAKKFMKILFDKKEYPTNKDFYLIKLDKVLANSKLSEDLHRRRESRFVLDCVNEKKSFLKFYQPLNDISLKEFFNGRATSSAMKSIGFHKNNKGNIKEPLYTKEPSIKIGGKFFINNDQNNSNNNNNNNIVKNNMMKFNLMNNSSKSRINSSNNFINNININNINSFNPRLSNTGYKTSKNVNNREKFDGLSLWDNINKNNNINSNSSNPMGNTYHGKFGKTMNDFTNSRKIGSRARINCIFNINDPLSLPKFINEENKIDPEEQIRNYIEFEKKMIN
jgi:hypothetical protein